MNILQRILAGLGLIGAPTSLHESNSDVTPSLFHPHAPRRRGEGWGEVTQFALCLGCGFLDMAFALHATQTPDGSNLTLEAAHPRWQRPQGLENDLQWLKHLKTHPIPLLQRIRPLSPQSMERIHQAFETLRRAPQAPQTAHVLDGWNVHLGQSLPPQPTQETIASNPDQTQQPEALRCVQVMMSIAQSTFHDPEATAALNKWTRFPQVFGT